MPGAAAGTVAYMSPEQASGEQLDARTDLFSLGAVLYKMAAGKPAFSGKTAAVIFNAILNGTPTPAIQLNPCISPSLAEIMMRLLEKDPDLRYQSAADLRSDLKRLRRDLDPHSAAAAPFTPQQAAAQPTAVRSGLVKPLRQRRVLAAALVFSQLLQPSCCSLPLLRLRRRSPARRR